MAAVVDSFDTAVAVPESSDSADSFADTAVVAVVAVVAPASCSGIFDIARALEESSGTVAEYSPPARTSPARFRFPDTDHLAVHSACRLSGILLSFRRAGAMMRCQMLQHSGPAGSDLAGLPCHGICRDCLCRIRHMPRVWNNPRDPSCAFHFGALHY